jgi:arylsulfatase A-like enzyme
MIQPLASRLLLFAALLLLVLAPSVARAADQSQQPPNILIILSDDHSAPHLGCYGDKDIHTPNLDKLASEGMRFDRAYVTCPQCAPSRSSILTGRHPIDIGMTRFSAALPREVITFPELLRKQKGYYTGLCGRSYHLSGTLLNKPEVKPYLKPQDFPNFDERYDYVKIVQGQDRHLRTETIREFGEFLDQVPAGKPFFLQLCWSDPHRPHTDDDLPYKHDPAKIAIPPFFPDAPAPRKDLAAYYDEVGRMDGNTGTVLQQLAERKLDGNTIVIFMGDNGASQLRGKGTLNELGVHVPLIIRYPGVIKPGSSTSALVSGDDLAPTLLAAAGVQAPDNLTGVSILPILKDASAKSTRTQVISERGPHASSLPRNSASFDLGRVIITDRYKLIYNAMWQIPYQPVDFNLDPIKKLHEEGKLSPELTKLYLSEHRPMFELYDLQDDPYEMKNLDGTPEGKKVEQELKGRLAAWMIQHHDFIPLPVTGNKQRTNAQKISGEGTDE